MGQEPSNSLVDVREPTGSSAHQITMVFIYLPVVCRVRIVHYNASTGSVMHHVESLDYFNRLP